MASNFYQIQIPNFKFCMSPYLSIWIGQIDRSQYMWMVRLGFWLTGWLDGWIARYNIKPSQ